MEVKILSRKLIKPSSPTPENFRNFQISFTDEMSPAMNVPLILFYGGVFGGNGDDDKFITCKHTLETSLAQILPQFYPLCGRYIERDRLIDCSDQGVEYLEAQVNYSLCHVQEAGIPAESLKPEELNHLLPCPFGAADEITDPMLSIQVNAFECGGLAIGICLSHRIADAATLGTFVSAWANACNPKAGQEQHIFPIFNSGQFFPSRNLPKLEMGIRRTMDDCPGPKILTRAFVFSGKAISELRSKCQQQQHPPTRVQLVSGLILRALLAIDQAKCGHPRASLVLQTVNFRKRTIPPIPEHSCGNFCLFAVAERTAEQNQSLDFQDCVNVVSDAVQKTIADCKKILNPEAEVDGHMVVIDPFNYVIQTFANRGNDLVPVSLNSWCRFPFYEADFGWGKPFWVSVASLPVRNSVLMMDTRDGHGVEAWVNLDENDMSRFLEDRDILTYAV
ncbi:OLC1v1021931C1 [Oldenlandia corymbosa var. corymbosa]|uniref:OLC1v1021931C1 n=1 Tax=Oldenlandia corymbosa var. corymbosa TaxID=529605 RepID=A0AAV1BWR1_OLDCO|nr:OLC1v1021931C1 [Oldenlandia corymbosa var. corymbosa]